MAYRHAVRRIQLAGSVAGMAASGLIPTAVVFVIAHMRLENREPWRLVLPQATVLTIFIHAVFDRFLAIPRPATLLGNLGPALKAIPSVRPATGRHFHVFGVVPPCGTPCR